MIIGLDIGGRFGFAIASRQGLLRAATYKLRGKKHGERYLNWRHFLVEKIVCGDVVVYEKVRRHLGTDAAHAYGAYEGILLEHCHLIGAGVLSFTPTQIKKFAAGKGNAGKPAMLEAARLKWPAILFEDDNAADAAWIAEMGRSFL